MSIFDELQSLGREIKIVTGSFAPQNTGVPATLLGIGWTVARTGTGTYTITLNDVYASLIAGVATFQAATAFDRFCQLGTVDLAAKTIVVRVWDVSATAVADTTIANDGRVNFTLFLKNSNATTQ